MSKPDEGFFSPTYRELQGLNKGFQAHHTLPQYLGKMLGYTKNSAQQTVALLKDYANTHSAEFNDPTKNREFLRPGANPEYAAYYANNLNFGRYDPTAETLGSVEGAGSALGDMLKGMYGLGKGLLTDTQNTASQVAHQVINTLSHPEAVVQEWQDMRAEATLYRLQGNTTAAARVEAEWQTKFVLSLVPVGKAGKMGQVSKTVAEREAIAEAVGGATGRQVPGLPSYYRDGSGVGANVVAPEGYTAVVNLRTGNFEFVAPDGKLYFYSESALVPKEGGNLAGLVAAEREIAAGKAGGGPKDTTRFIDGIKVVDQKTGQILQGTVDLGPTLDRIKSGGSFPHRNDGSIFQNRASDLPQKPAGYYTEYVHPTPGIAGPGPQRIVVGKGGEMYYTADHYKSFIPIKN
ncbi:TPA: hypothetical protein SMR42_005070 [Pseudomonas putida]|nr:hypothetical protein [Pseudomonas putida]